MLLNRVLGWDIDPTARLGVTVFANCGHVRVGKGVRIGHGNIFRNLRSVEIGDGAEIGQLNWFTVDESFLDSESERGVFSLGKGAALTSRHYLGCAGRVRIGDYSVIGGVRSVVFTAEMDVQNGRQRVRNVDVGSYCLIGAGVMVAPGAVIPDHSVISIGSVVKGRLEQPGWLYGGVPARPLRQVDTKGKWFVRSASRAPLPPADGENPQR
jgi:acetyltransferase-like isoleucine patch superfamily enzyme